MSTSPSARRPDYDSSPTPLDRILARMKHLLYTSNHPRQATSWIQDAITAALSAWLVAGVIVNVSVHASTGSDSSGGWQFLFYTAFVALAAWLGFLVWKEISTGRSGLAALPIGYGAAVAGVPLFLISGLASVIWHGSFGVEISPDILMSPVQLAVALTVILMASAPWLAAMARLDAASSPKPVEFLPGVLSFSAALAVVTLLFSFGIAFVYDAPTATALLQTDATGAFAEGALALVAAIVLTTVLVVSLLLFVGRRWHTPPGTFTVLFLGPALMIGAVGGFENKGTALLFFASGVLADALAWFVRPHLSRRRDLMIFAAGWAFATWLGLFVVGRIQGGEWAAPEIWSGAPVVTAFVAALLVLTVQPHSGIPPRRSAQKQMGLLDQTPEETTEEKSETDYFAGESDDSGFADTASSEPAFFERDRD